MSKKMLKRSLALGALMAFVITGSAMAAEYNVDATTDTGKLSLEKTDVKINDYKHEDQYGNHFYAGYTEPSTKHVVIEGSGVNAGETLTVVGNDGGQVAIGAYTGTTPASAVVKNIQNIAITGKVTSTDPNAGFSGNVFYTNGNGATLSFTGIGTIKTVNPAEGMIFHAISGGKISIGDENAIGADSINLNVNDNVIVTQLGGTTLLHANNIYFNTVDSVSIYTNYGSETVLKATNDITIETTSTALYINTEGKNDIELDANNITLNAGNAINIFGDNSVVDITAKNLMSIAATNSALSVQGDDSIVNINAPKAVINGGIFVHNGTLDITNVKDLVLQGLVAGNKEAAIQVEEGILKVNTTDTGTLAIEGAKAGDTYKVVSGAGEETALWKDTNLAYDRTTMIATSNHDIENKLYTVKYESFNDVTEVTEEIKEQFVAAVGGEEELAVPALVAASTGQGTVMEETAPGAKEFLAAVSSDAEMTKETKAAVINSAAQLAEAGGNAGTAVSVANNVAGVTTGRMSFGGRGHGGHKGGHGVGMFEEGSGAAVWAQYMHGKDDATDMPMDGGATSYESEYDGIVLGVDFKKVGKFQSGIAFNYGEGDSTGFTSAAKTKSDYDFWGIGYYGNIRNDDTNFIFDINYAKSDSDVTQHNAGATGDIEASPETTTWSAGVKVEKLYQNESVQIVPYTGLRYMSIDTDEYKSTMAGETLFNYAPERQDIWLLPLGVTIKQEVVNDNGWVVTPKVDLSYIWAFGDTDSNMSVSIPGIAASNDTLGFTVMDDGSFLGLVGVEAKLDDWTFGVSYSYQKGDYAESKKWFVDAKYSF